MAPDQKISVAELDKHAQPDNCWMIVNGQVYDLTRFAPEHPGGASGELSRVMSCT